MRIPLAVPQLGEDAEELLRECVRTNFVSSVGPFVGEFERQFAAAVGTQHAVACASGTAAIHLALLALGVGEDDDVLVSDLTFIASANPARYVGARVVLVDSERETWNLDPNLVIAELERRGRSGVRQPAAIIAVHLLGHPANFERLLDAATSYGVAVIEDAAESLGACWTSGALAGRQVGTVGTVGCFSFNGNKIITTGGGGMITSSDDRVTGRARHLSTQAKRPGIAYEHDAVGYNYRLTNVAAALGVSQLRALDNFVARKRQIADRYDGLLDGVRGVELPPRARWAARSAWLYSILLPTSEDRERLRVALADRGIDSRPIWKPIREQPPYADASVLGGSVAVDLASRALSIPCSVSLTDDEQDEVVGIVREVMDRA